jgi:hypothetical protein
MAGAVAVRLRVAVATATGGDARDEREQKR